MRHRRVSCVLGVLLVAGLLWPAEAAAQRRSRSHRTTTVTRAQGVRAVPRRSYSYRYYPRYSYYRPYSLGLYWGWGYPWYGYSAFYPGYYAYGYPYWYGYGGGPWGYPYRSYYDDYASVRVQASPRNAQVYVDGYFVGVVDDFDGTFQRLRVPPGGHEITLHLNGFRNASERMYLQPHSTYRLRTALEPLAAGAPQDPPPAPNPDAVRQGEEGEYGPGEPEAREPEGPPSRRWPPRQQAEERQARQATEESRFGTLSLRVQPPGSEILIDGAPWRGSADADGVLAIQVPAGTHRIEIRREGYVSYIADVNVRPSASTPLNVMLQQREN